MSYINVNVALEIDMRGENVSVRIATQNGESVTIWPSQLPYLIAELQNNLHIIQTAQAEAAPK